MPRTRTFTDDAFIAAVASCFSIACVLKTLGLSPTGANYLTVRKLVAKLRLDASHWTGQGHLRGKRHNWGKSFPLSEIMVENSTYTSCGHLKHRLIREGVFENKCHCCGQLPIWMNKPLVMIIDHKNGVHTDNRSDNLWLLCPACNSQQPTHAGRNKGKYS